MEPTGHAMCGTDGACSSPLVGPATCPRGCRASHGHAKLGLRTPTQDSVPKGLTQDPVAIYGHLPTCLPLKPVDTAAA